MGVGRESLVSTLRQPNPVPGARSLRHDILFTIGVNKWNFWYEKRPVSESGSPNFGGKAAAVSCFSN